MNTDNTMDKRQQDAAYAMIRSGKPMDQILKEFSVSDEEFTEWIRDGRFTEYAAALARGFAEANAPYVWTSLLRETQEGSIPAIKLYFEIWNKNRGTAAESAAGPCSSLTAVREKIFGSVEEE